MSLRLYVQPPLAKEDRLIDLAANANDEHFRVLGSMDDALYHANQAGKALHEARQLILNGQRKSKGGAWTKWLEKNFRGASSTAYQYMGVTDHYDELIAKRESFRAAEESWNYRRALREIADPNPSRPDDEADPFLDDPANQPAATEPEPEAEEEQPEPAADDPPTESDEGNGDEAESDTDSESESGLTDEEIEDLHDAGFGQDLVKFLLDATAPTEKLRGYSVQMIADAVLLESDETRERFLRQVPQIAAFWQELAVALETKGEWNSWAR